MIKREDLLSLEVYARRRDQLRAEVIAHKKRRTVYLGAHLSLLFEDQRTILYQVQEMLRIERIFEDEGIQGELDAYNPLVPDGGNWKATMLLEYPDADERRRMLGRLKGIEDRVWVQVGTLARVYAIADEVLERENEEKTSSVHFLRFELPAEAREALFGHITRVALRWHVASVDPCEIDRINILRASLLAMRRAVEALKIKPDEAWIDGNMCPDLACTARAFVDGDARHKPISAASILAKTARDAEMCALHDRFPHYGFDQHKGYATSEHLEAVGRLGPCEIHRRSFHAVGVFFQPNLFAVSWEGMAESLRIRSYRLYCEAVKLSNAARQLAHFEFQAKRLRKTYADVFAAREAASHVDMVRTLLRGTRAQLRAK